MLLTRNKNLFSTNFSKDSKATIDIPPKWQANLKQIIIAFNDSKRQKLKTYRRNTALFTAIGLVISLSLVIIAFEWKSYGTNDLVELGNISAEFEEMLDIPVTEQPPPPPPQAQVANILEVPDAVEIQEDLEINLDVEVTEESTIEEIIYEESEIEEEQAEEIFQFVEQSPEPPGGIKAFYKFISENLTYPPQARRSGVEGKVYLQFVIYKDGSIKDITVLKGIGFGCDEAAVKALSKSPLWNPGKQRGNPVNVRMALPIIFVLENV